LRLHIVEGELWFSNCTAGQFFTAAEGIPKMRKLLIVSIFPLLAAMGCADDGFLHRVEVWKQQTFFSGPDAQVITAPMAPMSEPTCAAPPAVAVEPGCEVPGAPISQTVGSPELGSPEVISGVLEQP
jgi:hypothetical protein